MPKKHKLFIFSQFYAWLYFHISNWINSDDEVVKNTKLSRFSPVFVLKSQDADKVISWVGCGHSCTLRSITVLQVCLLVPQDSLTSAQFQLSAPKPLPYIWSHDHWCWLLGEEFRLWTQGLKHILQKQSLNQLKSCYWAWSHSHQSWVNLRRHWVHALEDFSRVEAFRKPLLVRLPSKFLRATFNCIEVFIYSFLVAEEMFTEVVSSDFRVESRFWFWSKLGQSNHPSQK